jgi:hypothetical protein
MSARAASPAPGTLPNTGPGDSALAWARVRECASMPRRAREGAVRIATGIRSSPSRAAAVRSAAAVRALAASGKSSLPNSRIVRLANSIGQGGRASARPSFLCLGGELPDHGERCATISDRMLSTV